MNQEVEKPSVLLVEDDLNLGYLLCENLEAKEFAVVLCQDGQSAMKEISARQFDLCIIDVMLPGSDGFTVAKYLRQKQEDTPFIFLTARVQERDRLLGFEIGADDYISKPFSFKELYYRMLVVLRRKSHMPATGDEQIISTNNIVLNSSQRLLTVNGISKKLSIRENGLLQLLLENKNTYIKRSDILKKVWGNDDYFAARSMDVYITRIRKLLKDCDDVAVENLYGTGYRIKVMEVQEQ